MGLHYETVSGALLQGLGKIMRSEAFSDCYLVGGTALALQLGHRMSVDIDMFTNRPYGSLDLAGMRGAISSLFPYVERLETLDGDSMYYSLFVGENANELVKLDICYDEPVIFPLVEADGIRMADKREIAAMKMLAITTGSRRKDYWDLHELKNSYALEDMIGWALKRYPHNLERADIVSALLNADKIDDYTEVVSLKGGFWELVADDLKYEAEKLD